jgi:hypothetical protein
MKAHDHQIQFKGENKGLNKFIGVLHPTLGPQQKINWSTSKFNLLLIKKEIRIISI